MATKADEFDPSVGVLDALIRKILVPTLDELATETGVTYIAKIDVCVREEMFPKFSLSKTGVNEHNVEENVCVRIRFRRTFRIQRILFSIETQHAHQWRRTGLSGIRMHGEVLIDDGEISIKPTGKTVCYNSGWHGW